MMKQPAFNTFPAPRHDERPIWDLFLGHFGSHMLLIAHDLKLFTLLAEQPQTLPEICDALQLHPRPTQAMLLLGLSTGLLARVGDRYALTPIAEDYLLPNSPAYWGDFFNLGIANDANYSYESLRQAVLSNSTQVYGDAQVFQSHEQQIALAEAFTRGMHNHSMGAALVWPNQMDLSARHHMLDIGGGSGAHAIGAVLRWPNLQATVLDLPTVCQVTQTFIDQYHLADRIKPQALDMWNDPFPPADLHFYADIYHDWSYEKGRELTQKSFDSLEPGGQLVIHEMLFNDDKTGPLTVANYNIAMLMWTEGQQYSGPELRDMLQDAGFIEVEIRPTYGYWSLITGCKPS